MLVITIKLFYLIFSSAILLLSGVCGGHSQSRQAGEAILSRIVGEKRAATAADFISWIFPPIIMLSLVIGVPASSSNIEQFQKLVQLHFYTTAAIIEIPIIYSFYKKNLLGGIPEGIIAVVRYSALVFCCLSLMYCVVVIIAYIGTENHPLTFLRVGALWVIIISGIILPILRKISVIRNIEYRYCFVPTIAVAATLAIMIPFYSSLDYSASVIGFVAAQYDVGLDYWNGDGGVEKNPSQAIRYFQLAADRGYAPAQSELGQIYDFGLGGLGRDEATALHFYKLAASNGDEYAQSRLLAMGITAK